MRGDSCEKKKNLLLTTLVILLLSGCKLSLAKTTTENENSKIISDTIKDEISEYMNQFMSDYISSAGLDLDMRDYLLSEGLDIDKRTLVGGSTEGGEITKYENDIVVRYKLIYYGEMGKREINYYFIHDFIYYSCLDEYYSSPIYIKETDVLYRTLEEALLKDGVCYQYHKINNTFVQSDVLDIPYSSLEELNDLFDQSELLD
ncbi:hypothetical protein LBYZC6_38180 [Lacrimispora brassicae]